jgi:phycoerythrocyanin alpha-cysteine-84 phycoviolobilin lyase/isomerase subunit PecF
MIKTSEAIESLIGQLAQHYPAIITSVSEELINLAPDSVVPLLEAYNNCLDQAFQAKLISILAKIGDDQALDLLVEIVGVDVANHCQGNVRRVAARGLGKMVTSQTSEFKRFKAVNKLIWALLNTEDWGLRYASALSLKEIATKHSFDPIATEIKNSLEEAIAKESDQVVQTRIKLLLAN